MRLQVGGTSANPEGLPNSRWCGLYNVHTDQSQVQMNASQFKEQKMALWLFKQEPSCYSLADLKRDGSTTWDGVANALARKNLRQTKSGDRVLFYHTGKEKAVVGEMEI